MKTSDAAMAWCPNCKCWVPFNQMQYFDGIRACEWCVEGTPQPEGLVYDPYHEKTQCIYCDSYDTVELKPQWNVFKCSTCGEIFRRM